jgi:hypothetical protein
MKSNMVTYLCAVAIAASGWLYAWNITPDDGGWKKADDKGQEAANGWQATAEKWKDTSGQWRAAAEKMERTAWDRVRAKEMPVGLKGPGEIERRMLIERREQIRAERSGSRTARVIPQVPYDRAAMLEAVNRIKAKHAGRMPNALREFYSNSGEKIPEGVLEYFEKQAKEVRDAIQEDD